MERLPLDRPENDLEYLGLPAHLRKGFRAYIEGHHPIGHFGMAVLRNDLCEAVNRADGTSLASLPEIVRWLYNEAPGQCWGSPEKVRATHYEQALVLLEHTEAGMPQALATVGLSLKGSIVSMVRGAIQRDGKASLSRVMRRVQQFMDRRDLESALDTLKTSGEVRVDGDMCTWIGDADGEEDTAEDHSTPST